MTDYVPDTSVAAAWYLPETHSRWARDWQRRMLDGRVEFVVPTLHFVEMANLLRSLVRADLLTAELAVEIDDLHRDAPLQVADPPRDCVLTTALRFETTAYDAVLIALANELDTPLVTAERAGTPWVARLGPRAITIGDER